jgi:hypothetical protein
MLRRPGFPAHLATRLDPGGMPAKAATGRPQRPYALHTRQVTRRPSRAYCQGVIIAAALAGVIVLMAAALIWAARLLHIGNLDMQALADKLATPEPVSALDWPELRVQAVIPEPGGQPLVLLKVGWPAHPRQAATLLVALDRGDQRALPLLAQWCARQASVAPVRQQGCELEFRRRQSLERVHAVLVAEQTMAAPYG